MIRRQRLRHRVVWLVLAPALVAVLVWAVFGGQRYAAQPAPDGVVQGEQR